MGNFLVVRTNELSFLIACIEKGCYGVSVATFRSKLPDSLRTAVAGDLVFLRLQDVLVCGPFVLEPPPSAIKISQVRGIWGEIDQESSPSELLPQWVGFYPWCFFFDSSLVAHANYINMKSLQDTRLFFPQWGQLTAEDGQKAWALIDEQGSSVADYASRLKPATRMPRPRGPLLQPDSRRYKTDRGVMVRTRGEKIIDDWLHAKCIRAEYEKCIYLDRYVIRPDFYLPDLDLYLEYLGLLGVVESYSKDWEWKLALYRKHGVRIVTVLDPEISDIDKALTSKLGPYRQG